MLIIYRQHPVFSVPLGFVLLSPKPLIVIAFQSKKLLEMRLTEYLTLKRRVRASAARHPTNISQTVRGIEGARGGAREG